MIWSLTELHDIWSFRERFIEVWIERFFDGYQSFKPLLLSILSRFLSLTPPDYVLYPLLNCDTETYATEKTGASFAPEKDLTTMILRQLYLRHCAS